MKTLGIDLSSDPKDTAVCMVIWGANEAKVQAPALKLADSALVDQMLEADWTGIDAPFGWPDGMVLAIHRYATEGKWGGLSKDEFRYRLTDRFARDHVPATVGKTVTPLSVSADKFAMLAWRLAQLREVYSERAGQRFDRAGGDRVVEVYPASALLLWGLERAGYKTGRGGKEKQEQSQKAREDLLISIEEQAPYLSWAEGAKQACADNDDALDALLSALVARAAAIGRTTPPPPADAEQIAGEGWIHLPEVELGELAVEPPSLPLDFR